jgi:hypothetical protein
MRKLTAEDLVRAIERTDEIVAEQHTEGDPEAALATWKSMYGDYFEDPLEIVKAAAVYGRHGAPTSNQRTFVATVSFLRGFTAGVLAIREVIEDADRPSD